MTLVSGLQHFNLWRIISWGWLLLLALGGWGANRCSTKRHLFIHHAAVVTIPVGKKRILLMCSTAPWNTESSMCSVLASKLPLWNMWFTHRNTKLESGTVLSCTFHSTPTPTPPTYLHTHTHSTVCGQAVSGWVSFAAALTIISKFIHANSARNWFRPAHSKNRPSHCDCKEIFWLRCHFIRSDWNVNTQWQFTWNVALTQFSHDAAGAGHDVGSRFLFSMLKHKYCHFHLVFLGWVSTGLFSRFK